MLSLYQSYVGFHLFQPGFSPELLVKQSLKCRIYVYYFSSFITNRVPLSMALDGIVPSVHRQITSLPSSILPEHLPLKWGSEEDYAP
jgi:hypothetical protein